jgi:hypothetical protein
MSLLFNPSIRNMGCKLISDGDAAHSLLNPVVRIAFCLIQSAGSFGCQLGVLYLLNAFITDLCQPPLEWFCLRGWDGLNNAKNAFCVGAIDLLVSSGSLYQKGGWQFAPTLSTTPCHDAAYL